VSSSPAGTSGAWTGAGKLGSSSTGNDYVSLVVADLAPAGTHLDTADNADNGGGRQPSLVLVSTGTMPTPTLTVRVLNVPPRPLSRSLKVPNIARPVCLLISGPPDYSLVFAP
jgi:hypothetical protein